MLNLIIQISCGYSLYFYLTVLSGTYTDHFPLFTSTVQYIIQLCTLYIYRAVQVCILVHGLGFIISTCYKSYSRYINLYMRFYISVLKDTWAGYYIPRYLVHILVHELGSKYLYSRYIYLYMSCVLYTCTLGTYTGTWAGYYIPVYLVHILVHELGSIYLYSRYKY